MSHFKNLFSKIGGINTDFLPLISELVKDINFCFSLTIQFKNIQAYFLTFHIYRFNEKWALNSLDSPFSL